MKTVGIVVATLLVAGCATTQKFQAKMDGFVGQSEMAVISAYGVPENTYTANDGTKYLQYTRGSNIVIPGATTFQPVTTNTTGRVTMNQGLNQATGNYTQQSTTYVQNQGPATNIALSCRVTFAVSGDGIVKRWDASGNHCKSN